MHAADIAYVLEVVAAGRSPRGVEASQSGTGAGRLRRIVRRRAALPRRRGWRRAILRCSSASMPEDLAYRVRVAARGIEAPRVTARSKPPERTIFEDSIQYDRTAVGHHMTREWVEVDERQTVGDILYDLARPRRAAAADRPRATWSMPGTSCAAPSRCPCCWCSRRGADSGLAAESSSRSGRTTMRRTRSPCSNDMTSCRRRSSTIAASSSAGSPSTR